MNFLKRHKIVSKMHRLCFTQLEKIANLKFLAIIFFIDFRLRNIKKIFNKFKSN